MILQSLYDYYQRKTADPESNMPLEGFEWKEIPFIIVINLNGEFITIEDTREGEIKNRKSKKYLVPKGIKRSGRNFIANLLWDNIEYVLKLSPSNRNIADLQKQHDAFINEIKNKLPQENPYVKALLKFLLSEPIKQIELSKNDKDILLIEEIKNSKSNPNLTFNILETSDKYTTICDALKEDILPSNDSDQVNAICLVSGKRLPVERTHPSIKGVRGTLYNAALSSFNLPSFRSFGKKQNYNAPISKHAAFAYTTALNSLLEKESTQKILIGDTTTIFWAERPNFLENDFALLFGLPRDNPDMGTEAIKAKYQSVHSGKLAEDGDIKFYVLGLSPNVTRISVRFWYQGTVAGLWKKIRDYFYDIKIVRSQYDKDDKGYDSLVYLLCNLVLEGKIDNIPPNLVGDVMRSILNGSPLPIPLLHLAIRRIRAEQNITRPRAAILKAVLNRTTRKTNNDKEITVSLDLTNNNPGYLLGRLFAVLEKIQKDAQPGIKATIRDRYYGAASSNPISVFPQLLKLKNHHLTKLDNPGLKINHEKRLTEIFAGISDIPSHLTMEDQARFAIGYYHQRQKFFEQKPQTDSSQA